MSRLAIAIGRQPVSRRIDVVRIDSLGFEELDQQGTQHALGEGLIHLPCISAVVDARQHARNRMPRIRLASVHHEAGRADDELVVSAFDLIGVGL